MITTNTEDFTINKLIVLYLLNEIKLSLSLSQITQIVLDKGYADYFSMQLYLNQLIEAKLIIKHQENNASYFGISESGKQTLEFFASRIPYNTRVELDEFIKNNWRTLKSELDITAQYIPNKEHEYIVHCKITENNTSLIELNINVSTKKQALTMCNNWRNNANDLYVEILQLLNK